MTVILCGRCDGNSKNECECNIQTQDHLNRQRKLTLSYLVREDLPSETIRKYDYLFIEALKSYAENQACTPEDHKMIDRILNDNDSRPEAIKLHAMRRALWDEIYQATGLELEILEAQLDVVNKHITKLG